MNYSQSSTKKDNAVVFGLTSKLVFAVASVMIDLRDKSPGFVDEVIILHDGKVKEKDKKLLNKILPTRFIEYNFPLKDKLAEFDQLSLNAYTYMVHSIYECFSFLNEFKNVIWLDFDIVIKRDISDITAISSYDLAFGGLSRKSKGLYRHPVKEYDMEKISMNTGIVVFKDTLGDYNKIYDFCYQTLDKQKNNLALPDQAVMFIVYEEFKLNYGLLPDNYVIDASAKTEDSHIIHSAGSKKFWNSKERTDTQWTRNYREWVHMGGTKSRDMMLYKKIKKRIKSILKK